MNHWSSIKVEGMYIMKMNNNESNFKGSNAFSNTNSTFNSGAPVPVTIYWDIENCSVPNNMRAYEVVVAIRNYGSSIGVVRNISCFANLMNLSTNFRNDLQLSGVLLVDVPSGKPQASDMAFLVEFLKLACDCPPPHHIILISGDRDFSTVLHVLSMRGYQVTLIHSSNALPVLKSAANVAIEWRKFLSDFSSSTSKLPDVVDNAVHPPENNGNNQHATQDSAKKKKKKATKPETPPQPSPAKPKSTAPPKKVTPDTTKSIFESGKFMELMKKVMKTCKRDYFLPTESAVQGTLRRLLVTTLHAELTPSLWNEALNRMMTDSTFSISGTAPHRIIYMGNDKFRGVDPNSPSGVYGEEVWDALAQFIKEVHPIKKQGRYGMACFIKEKGPSTIKKLKLGQITELVQLAIDKLWMKHHKGFVETTDGSSIHSQINSSHVSVVHDLMAIILECVRFITSKKNRVQIGSLSGHLKTLGHLQTLKQNGGLRKFLEGFPFFELQTDSQHGTYVSVQVGLLDDMKDSQILQIIREKLATVSHVAETDTSHYVNFNNTLHGIFANLTTNNSYDTVHSEQQTLNSIKFPVYIGNLPFDLDLSQLVKFVCSENGIIVENVILFTTQSGKSKGLAVIECIDSDNQQKALATLNGRLLLGRALLAYPKLQQVKTASKKLADNNNNNVHDKKQDPNNNNQTKKSPASQDSIQQKPKPKGNDLPSDTEMQKYLQSLQLPSYSSLFTSNSHQSSGFNNGLFSHLPEATFEPNTSSEFYDSEESDSDLIQFDDNTEIVFADSFDLDTNSNLLTELENGFLDDFDDESSESVNHPVTVPQAINI